MVYFYSGQYREAIKYAEEAISFYKDTARKRAAILTLDVFCHLAKGYIAGEDGNYSEALNKITKAETIYALLKNGITTELFNRARLWLIDIQTYNTIILYIKERCNSNIPDTLQKMVQALGPLIPVLAAPDMFPKKAAKDLLPTWATVPVIARILILGTLCDSPHYGLSLNKQLRKVVFDSLKARLLTVMGMCFLKPVVDVAIFIDKNGKGLTHTKSTVKMSEAAALGNTLKKYYENLLDKSQLYAAREAFFKSSDLMCKINCDNLLILDEWLYGLKQPDNTYPVIQKMYIIERYMMNSFWKDYSVVRDALASLSALWQSPADSQAGMKTAGSKSPKKEMMK